MKMVALAVILIVLILYPVGMRYLARYMQAKRIEMGLVGERLINGETLNASQKFVLGSMIRDAYDARIAFVLSLVAPGIVVGIIFGRIDPDKVRLPDTEEVKKFSALHAQSIAAANPVCFAIFLLELAVSFPFLLPFLFFGKKYAGARANDFMLLANTRADKKLHYLPA